MMLNIFRPRAAMPLCSPISSTGQRPCKSGKVNPGAIKMSASIHQQVDFKATPERVYQALTDAKQFSAFSGLPAEIHGEAGGVFKCFGGQIKGRMTELSPGKKIVQTWHVAMWPDGVESMVRIELKPHGEGTRLILDHSDFPEGNREHLDAGWPRMYWEPLRKHLA